MLLIWDIHIHPRHSDGIVQMLRDFVKANDHEQHIVFVGDYVYHFSYHRPSLLALLDFFLELVQMGKTVYVLAGNHDRLGQHFVYAEAEKILSPLTPRDRGGSPLSWWPTGRKDSNCRSAGGEVGGGSLHFITSPQIVHIESEDVFFLPYMLSRKDSDELNQFVNNMVASYELWVMGDGYETTRNPIHSQPIASLTIIHHYYVAETAFPGLKVKFGYKDLALSPRWLDDERVRLISGHIHHPFSYKNYLCVGAVRSTSPQEINQLQYLFAYNLTTGEAIAHQVAYNTYLQIEHPSSMIDEKFLQSFRARLQSHHQDNLQAGQKSMTIVPCVLDVAKISLAVMSNQLEYDTLHEQIAPQLMQWLSDVKLKRSYESSDLIVAQLIDETQNFSSWRGDRKQLLDDYLTQKFGDRKSIYEEMLREVGV